jgi:hypothetical protein
MMFFPKEGEPNKENRNDSKPADYEKPVVARSPIRSYLRKSITNNQNKCLALSRMDE